MPNLKIECFETKYVPNPNPRSDETPFEEFWSVRDQVLEASRRHAPTGPEVKDPKMKFYLVDDQYNDDLYQNMELYDPNALTEDWVGDICDVLKRNTGWAVALSFGHFCILIFADRILVPADKFSDVSSLGNVLKSAGEQITWNKSE